MNEPDFFSAQRKSLCGTHFLNAVTDGAAFSGCRRYKKYQLSTTPRVLKKPVRSERVFKVVFADFF